MKKDSFFTGKSRRIRKLIRGFDAIINYPVERFEGESDEHYQPRLERNPIIVQEAIKYKTKFKDLIHNAGKGYLGYLKFKFTNLDFDTMRINAMPVCQRMNEEEYDLMVLYLE